MSNKILNIYGQQQYPTECPQQLSAVTYLTK